ncbi:glycerophosphodiester phosphodiesterase [Bacillus sp. CRN 9]|uniref:glycerophosphodiester phosphodiesterase n=1 Tax=Cytobacillus horneckiae TaxID=549687 RepID=UPI0015620B7F|nr:glycerophosphodiester phosphodiesterase [Bacillus sp. CRN 9]
MVSHASIFAHRGLSGHYPENTMAAFQAAMDSGADGIELDVQMTKDGQLVIIHDERIDRTTDGNGYVKDFTYEELNELDAGGWFASSFTGESLPTLENVFQWLVKESNRLTLNIELKNDIIHYEGMEEKVLNLIDDYQLEDRIILSSFNAQSLKKVRELHPTISIGYLIAGIRTDALAVAEDIGADAIHCQEDFALSNYGKKALEAGFPLRVYTVNRYEAKADLVAAGVEVIMTDYPEQFK